MAETGAVFGGEHSGHYYFRDNYRADSGHHRRHGRPRAAQRHRRAALRAAGSPFKRYADSGEINTVVDDPAGAVELMAAEVEAAGGALGTGDRLDGLTVDRGTGGTTCGPSNTEPLLRLNVEAPDAGALCPPGGRGPGGHRPAARS